MHVTQYTFFILLHRSLQFLFRGRVKIVIERKPKLRDRRKVGVRLVQGVGNKNEDSRSKYK